MKTDPVPVITPSIVDDMFFSAGFAYAKNNYYNGADPGEILASLKGWDSLHFKVGVQAFIWIRVAGQNTLNRVNALGLDVRENDGKRKMGTTKAKAAAGKNTHRTGAANGSAGTPERTLHRRRKHGTRTARSAGHGR